MTDIRLSTEDAVRVLTIDRPHRCNAMTQDTADELREAILAAQRDEAVGAVVLTGAGDHFSAGGDAATILQVVQDESDEPRLGLMRSFRHLVETVWESDLPVVAAVSGAAYGGGFNLALACDLIVCSADARFCQVFLRRGLAPDVGGAYLLPRLVGMQRAKELMLRSSEVNADRAIQMGFVNEVLPNVEAAYTRAVELATELATKPRFAMSLTKKLVNSSAAGTLHTALELEAFVQTSALRSPRAREEFEAFVQPQARPARQPADPTAVRPEHRRTPET